MEGVVVALLTACPLLGLITRRWLALIFPVMGWPLFYAGVVRGWWAYGTGDAWQFVAAVFTILGVGSTALLISVARAFRPPTSHVPR